MKKILPAVWVDDIFSRLQVRYGSAWIAMWKGVEISAVKADWANELGGYADYPEGIKHGLANLPADWPPTVAQFVVLCQGRVEPALPALNPPPADPAIVAAVAGALRPPKGQSSTKWANRLRTREQGGERLSLAQRAMWRAALQPQTESIPA